MVIGKHKAVHQRNINIKRGSNAPFKNIIMKKIFSIFSLSMFFFTTNAQIGIRVSSNEFFDIKGVTIIGENDKLLKLIIPTERDGFFIIDTSGVTKIKFSHVSFFDTTVIVNTLKKQNDIFLRPKVVQLENVLVINKPEKEENNFSIKKNKKMFFQLEDTRTWFFSVNMRKYQSHLITGLFFKFKNLSISDTLQISVYNNEAAILNKNPSGTKVIVINKQNIKNSIGIDEFGDADLSTEGKFFVSFNVKRFNKLSTTIPAVLTALQANETQLYILGKNNIIDKFPMDYFKTHNNAYPELLYSIKYK
ncbi:MAG: hypothetical protein RIR12_923 [Bacteroidota bacterium]|jgi:hypothetical protein